MTPQPLFTIHRKAPTPVIGRDPALTMWIVKRIAERPVPARKSLTQKLLTMLRK